MSLISERTVWKCNCGHEEPYREPTNEEIELYGSMGIPHEHLTFGSQVNENSFYTTETAFMWKCIKRSYKA